MTTGTKRLRYVLRRLLHAVPVLLGIAVVNFLLLQLAPGDAADVLAGEAGSATPEYMAMLRKNFGLDKSIPEQLFIYIKNLLMFDLGFSFRHGMPVLELILDRLWPTLLLMVTTLFLSVGVGIGLGLIAATKVNSWRDAMISVLAIVSYATPLFWVGLMLIVVFSIKLDMLPATGMEDVVKFYEGLDRVADVAVHLILPAVTLSLFYLALYTRLMRAAVLEQHGMDYVVTARAKGASERRVIFRHVLQNAILPGSDSWRSRPSSPGISTSCWVFSFSPRVWSW
jgi:peptide/nickel transport system permease protein